MVKTTFCGICHSDVHMADDELHLGGGQVLNVSSIPGFNFPAVFGHEIAGVIHSMDPSANDDRLKVGDRVAIYPWTGCDKCEYCLTGDGSMCATSQPLGCGRDGGFSEYVSLARRDIVVKLPDALSMDIACMLCCSGVTGYNAVQKVKPTVEYFQKLNGQATLLIVGAGGLGIWCLQTARASLPKGTKIIIADINEEKLRIAKEHGADETVHWDAKLSEKDIVALTKSKAVNGEINAIIDFVNSTETTTRSFQYLRKGGAMALVGLFGGAMSVPLPIFALNIWKVFGVYVGTLQEFKELVNLVATAKLTPPDINYVSLEEIPEVLTKLKNGQVKGRSIVKF